MFSLVHCVALRSRCLFATENARLKAAFQSPARRPPGCCGLLEDPLDVTDHSLGFEPGDDGIEMGQVPHLDLDAHLREV